MTTRFDDGETLEPHKARPTTVAVPSLRLVYDAGRGVAESALRLLRRGSTGLGRTVEGEGGIRVDDPRASRVHAEIVVDATGARLANRSKFGTRVNGATVHDEHTLVDRDVVAIGDSLFVYRTEPVLDGEEHDDGPFLGVSPEAARVRSEIRLAARSATAVLVIGATGTGKEVVAAALHAASGRTGALVPVNASAIPESLAESQLFGHRQGAFTGARADHRGFFVEADGGTLLLDEIGDLPLTIQPKLLRALEERRVLAVGATRAVPVDVLVIGATHHELEQRVRDGAFRADLYARLAELIIRVPTLDARREDILLLAESRLSPDDPRIGPALAERLLLYRWPFNVRELQKVMAEARARGAGRDLLELDLVEARLPLAPADGREGPAAAGSPDAPTPPPDRSPIPIPDRATLEEMLARHHGVVADIAREVGRSRKQVYRWITEAGLDVERYRGT